MILLFLTSDALPIALFIDDLIFKISDLIFTIYNLILQFVMHDAPPSATDCISFLG